MKKQTLVQALNGIESSIREQTKIMNNVSERSVCASVDMLKVQRDVFELSKSHKLNFTNHHYFKNLPWYKRLFKKF